MYAGGHNLYPMPQASNAAPPKAAEVRSPKAAADRCSFLDLPREIRDSVYAYAFEVRGAILIFSMSDFHVRRNAKASIVRHKDEGPLEPQPVSDVIPIQLLFSCRQIHAESSPFLYGRNTFRFYASSTNFAPRYRAYIRHIIFTTDSMVRKIFDNDRDIASYWWRRHFFPDVLQKSARLLLTYPDLKTLTFAITSAPAGWVPAFMASPNKTPEQRIAQAAAWLKGSCLFGGAGPRLEEVLQMEIISTGHTIPRELYFPSSRFAPEEEWDCSEFAKAFAKMKLL